MPIQNNTLIAKNTLYLYVRMFIMMGISLYTSRVVLDVLGVSDYGIYNLVGGIVLSFHFLNSTINGTMQRFFNVEMGRGSQSNLNRCFNAGLEIQLIFSFFVILLSETIGMWFINEYLNIDENRMNAAKVVFQFSMLVFCVNLLRTPFQAILIASEKMDFYAYSGILEGLLKLGSLYILLCLTYDKLIVYAILQLLVTIFILALFILEIRRHFKFTLKFHIDWSYFKPMLFFSGWNLLGSSFALTVSQVINIILNIFYGVTLNAATGLASSISGAINQFAANFSVAFSPQIVKLYAAGEMNSFIKLVTRASKTSFLLYSLIALPFVCLSDGILKIWLVEVPPYAVLFAQLCVLDIAIESFAPPFYSSIQASGKVKGFNMGISFIFLLNIPLMYFSQKLGLPPFGVYLVKIGLDIVNLVFRVVYMSRCVPYSVSIFFFQVLCPCIAVMVLVLPIAFYITFLEIFSWQVLCTLLLLVPLQILFSFYLGYNKRERGRIKTLVINKLRHQ